MGCKESNQTKTMGPVAPSMTRFLQGSYRQVFVNSRTFQGHLTLCKVSNFSCFCCHMLTFFFQNYNYFKKTFKNTTGPDLCPNCLQRLSVDDNLLRTRKELKEYFTIFKDYNEVNKKILIFSKTCVKRPFKNRQNKDLDDKW